MKPMIRIETPTNYRETEILTREAFWNVYRPGCSEHCVLHYFRSRPEFLSELSLVMELDGRIVAHIMYSKAEITGDDGRSIPIVVFGPVSVLPECQHQGYGAMLIRASLEKAQALGHGAVAITGSPAYYQRFGFRDARACGIFYADIPRTEETPFFLIKELQTDFLTGITGTYRDPSGYFIADEVVDAFDTLFPPKQKLVLPGQLT